MPETAGDLPVGLGLRDLPPGGDPPTVLFIGSGGITDAVDEINLVAPFPQETKEKKQPQWFSPKVEEGEVHHRGIHSEYPAALQVTKRP